MKQQNYNVRSLSESECELISGGGTASDFTVPDECFEVDPDRKKKKRTENGLIPDLPSDGFR
jgi:hypothetical protein